MVPRGWKKMEQTEVDAWVSAGTWRCQINVCSHYKPWIFEDLLYKIITSILGQENLLIYSDASGSFHHYLNTSKSFLYDKTNPLLPLCPLLDFVFLTLLLLRTETVSSHTLTYRNVPQPCLIPLSGFTSRSCSTQVSHCSKARLTKHLLWTLAEHHRHKDKKKKRWVLAIMELCSGVQRWEENKHNPK